ncbi:MAG: sugar ABC transporter permease [Clostridiales bacterium]|jgi:arabinogalactan oligomer/maltooligosaccharide transport system permease protein|nr:sugar ABC transporter permease [Clostridiales bacterium]
MNSSASRKKILIQIITYTILVFISLTILYPLAITVISAFMPGNLMAFKLNISSKWTLENFNRLINTTLYVTWYRNTLTIALFTMLIQLIIVSLAGYTYSRFRFSGRKNSLKFFLIVQMIPTMAAFTAFYVMGLMINGLDKYWYITLIYIGGGIPMNTWLMRGYFDTVPISLDEAARIEGAGRLRVFWQIILPLVRPMIAVQALWAFMTPFGEYMLARFLLRSSDALTVSVGLQTFVADPRTQKVALFAAGAILVSLPIVILFFVLQKNFVSGLTSGGAKE